MPSRSHVPSRKYAPEEEEPPCERCGGTGSIPLEVDGPPVHKVCLCVLKRRINANLERGMKGLSRWKGRVDESPLTPFVDKNAWITADRDWFLTHVRHVAARQPNLWGFRVTTDAAMMRAWLATAAFKGLEILDPDGVEEAAQTTFVHLTLDEAILPPALLVIRLGVKHARNSAMPEVLSEALLLREHEGKPTWLWDNDEHPFMSGHISWAPDVADRISSWSRVRNGEVRGRERGASYLDDLLDSVDGDEDGDGEKQAPSSGDEAAPAPAAKGKSKGAGASSRADVADMMKSLLPGSSNKNDRGSK